MNFAFLKNWRTTLAGALSLAAAGYSVYTNPASILNPSVIGLVTTGAGLIVAHDGVLSPTQVQPGDPSQRSGASPNLASPSETMSKPTK